MATVGSSVAAAACVHHMSIAAAMGCGGTADYCDVQDVLSMLRRELVGL